MSLRGSVLPPELWGRYWPSKPPSPRLQHDLVVPVALPRFDGRRGTFPVTADLTGDGSARLLGRRAERVALDRVVEEVRSGCSSVLVVRGEPGVGKSVLLDYLVDRASGCRVARAGGIASEMELPLAGLQQLMGAWMLERIDDLPPPQREALRLAFGLSEGPAPDRFLLGLAALSLLSDAAEKRPLVCVIDDVQWLDRESAQVLSFVARRLEAEPLAMVFALREPCEVQELDGLPGLVVEGLGDEDARALLASGIPGGLDEQVRDRIVAETRGNPLALLELPRGLSATELAGGFGLGGAHALPGRIEQSYLRRLETLPDDTRLLLLVAAAEPVGDPLLTWRAAERLGVGAAAAASAEGAGLLAISERVVFRHPLVRSAIYRAGSTRDRQAVHLALADATDREADADRRAWHLAAAAQGPDEQVALELERSAGRAQARGGFGAAAAFLQRAVALTGDMARRVNRALAAAHASLEAGAFAVALGMLAMAEAGSPDALQRARVDLLRAEAAYAQSRGSDAPPLLLRAAKRLEPLDPELARETYLDAWSAALFAGRFANSGGLGDVSRESRDAPRPTGAPRPSDQLLDGFALLFTDGRAEATPVLQRAASGFAGDDVSLDEVLRWGWLATAAAVTVWDFETCLAIADREVEVARDAGALAVLAVGANVLAQAVALSGEFGKASLVIAEADAVVEATGTGVLPYGALVLAGLRGREAEASPLIDATTKDATAAGQGTAVQYARWASAILFNGLGRYDEALAAARDASDDAPELFVSAWALSELIEAAGRSGQTEIASSALRRLAEHAQASPTDWGLGIVARSNALLSEGKEAERLFREAIERLDRTPLRPECARAHLLYGEWLRRENRRVEAREQLSVSHDMLAGIGMEAFAERARGELSAIGGKARKSSAETRDDLTDQERQIAQLARDGLSNPEIGARLFLSPRTVEWHLHKVFGKLGIGSRRELPNALPSVASQFVDAPPEGRLEVAVDS
jgi:DNA-binding CsgD family transcriptional regulator/tetratricopeptide (TPR) repeat protein